VTTMGDRPAGARAPPPASRAQGRGAAGERHGRRWQPHSAAASGRRLGAAPRSSASAPAIRAGLAIPLDGGIYRWPLRAASALRQATGLPMRIALDASMTLRGSEDAWRLCDAADTTRLRVVSAGRARSPSPPPSHLPPCPSPPGLAAARYTHTHAHALHTPRYSRPLSHSSPRLSADHRSAIIELHLRRRLPFSRALPTNLPLRASTAAVSSARLAAYPNAPYPLPTRLAPFAAPMPQLPARLTVQYSIITVQPNATRSPPALKCC
jgi:hypothetical protein